MHRPSYPSFRSVLNNRNLLRVAGAHDALGGVLAEQAGFDAVWSSSLEVSAVRCLPDASLLTMTEYLEAAVNIQKALHIPVVADCDTGYGNAMNVTHMVHEYEAAGITAVCLEDKLFPKLNSFAQGDQTLLSVTDFAHKIASAKQAQRNTCGLLRNRPDRGTHQRTAPAGSFIRPLRMPTCTRALMLFSSIPSLPITSKSSASCSRLGRTEPGWSSSPPHTQIGTSMTSQKLCSVVIYANQGLRATVSALRSAYGSIIDLGNSTSLEGNIASVTDVFALQRLSHWQAIEKPSRT